jgi:hypothetical protein
MYISFARKPRRIELAFRRDARPCVRWWLITAAGEGIQGVELQHLLRAFYSKRSFGV